LLYRRGVGAVAPVFFILAVGAATFRALYGVSTKYALEQGAAAEVMLIIAAVSWVIGGLLYAALRERRVRFTGKKAAYSLISGTLCFAVVNALIEALKLGEASIVLPVANLSFVVSMAISVVLGLETLGVRKYAAIGCAVVSVFLLSQAN
ncbi:MAG: EamA family transporter, partial [Pseudomonadota bacterium]|nr:EamA family transporter [Pseudomonadota bacterium]